MSLRLPSMPPDPDDPPSERSAPLSTLRLVYDANVGLLLLSIAQFFFASMSVTVKYLLSATSMSTLTVIVVRMFITSCCCIAALVYNGDPHPVLGPPGIRRALAFRGLCGWLGLTAGYQSLRGLSVSDGAAIAFLGPTATAIVGYVWLREVFTPREAASGLASLLGVLLVSRPQFLFGRSAHGDAGEVPIPTEDMIARAADGGDALRAVSVVWALLAVACTALAYTSIRFIGDRATALHSINYFAMMCCVGSAIGMWATSASFSEVQGLRDFGLVIMIGFFGFTGQTLVTLGLQREKAGRGSLSSYVQVFFALALEFFVFGTTPGVLSILGITIILASTAYTADPPHPDDTESQPISRAPSPLPAAERTVRGEHYSYAAVPRADGEPAPGAAASPSGDAYQ